MLKYQSEKKYRFFNFKKTILVGIILYGHIGITADENSIPLAELQWSLCESSFSFLKHLGIQEFEYNSQSQYYFDTQDLQLLDQRIQIRIRKDQDKFTSTLKLNFNEPQQIPENLKNDFNTTCEYDTYLDHDKIGCKTKNSGDSLQDVFSINQKNLLKDFIPNIDLEHLKTYGPYKYEKWSAEFDPKTKIIIDSLSNKQNQRFYEVSTRVETEERTKKLKELTNYFIKKGVVLCPTPVDRTRIVLTSPEN